MYRFAKRKLQDLYRYTVEPRLEALHAESIYQGIFAQQCASLNVQRVFYPVGAAASYSLMYLLCRVATELNIRSVIEFGCGQSTLLLDQVLDPAARHTALEQDEIWAKRIAGEVRRTRVEHTRLVDKEFEGVSYAGYAASTIAPFDLLLVDGPIGTDRHSRYDCVPLIAGNLGRDFIAVIDDADRPGEQETIAHLTQRILAKGVDVKINYLRGRTTQAVLTTPAFRAASYFF